MDIDVGPEQLGRVVRELSYPAMRPDAAAELKDVTIVLEDRELSLGAIISDTDADSYQEPEELLAAVRQAIYDDRN